MSQPLIYYRLQRLPEAIKAAFKIRATKRLDCTYFTDETESGYKGLEPFLNHKGMLFFFLTEGRQFVTAKAKRVAEWSLTNRSMNLSSLYIEDFENPEYAYGYPNASQKLSNGSENPMYAYRSDGYLFILSDHLEQIELIVLPDQRNMISDWYQLLIDNELEQEIKRLRQNAKPFFDYGL
jgi:hypothetical protein